MSKKEYIAVCKDESGKYTVIRAYETSLKNFNSNIRGNGYKISYSCKIESFAKTSYNYQRKKDYCKESDFTGLYEPLPYYSNYYIYGSTEPIFCDENTSSTEDETTQTETDAQAEAEATYEHAVEMAKYNAKCGDGVQAIYRNGNEYKAGLASDRAYAEKNGWEYVETVSETEPEEPDSSVTIPEQKKYLDMIQDVEQMAKYRDRYTIADDFCIDVIICTHDLKDKNDLMHHWKKAGYVKEVSETHIALDCYYTDLQGNCWERYNPTIKKGKLDFEWILPYTAANAEKLLAEAIKRYVEDSELYVVDLNDKFAHIYSTVKCGEDWFDAVDRAYQNAHEDAETCRKWLQKYPENADYWKARIEAYEKADYCVMRYTDFQRIQRERILKQPLQEVTADDYEEMLNILPPMHWVEINGVSEFCMMEMYTGTYTNQYAHDKKTGKYFTKLVDVTDRDTWIHKILERK